MYTNNDGPEHPAFSSNVGFPPNSQLGKWTFWIQTSFQKFLDDSTPWITARWGASAGLLFLYILRVAIWGGWYIVSYALGIYLLNLLIGFLSPKIDPEFDADSGDSDAPSLPTSKDDEFRPFVRRLPEFKFWYSTTRALLIGLCCTMTRMLDIPVFWPILLIYFIALFVMTMKKQIKHMIKYKYIPFTWNKPKYANQKDSK